MMASKTREKFENPVVEWIDSRLPIFTMMQKEYGVFPTPKNFNYFWNFGAIAMFMLVTMLLSGIFLAMNYTPHVDMAFDSVDRIMRDVEYGWLIRYIHMNGASFFFIAVFIHMFRGLYYGSYKNPRELLWIIGVVIFLLMMATAFMGYVLPWGQMSLWGAKVITNLFSAIPFIGEDIVTFLLGGFTVDNPTLNRFFALHYLLPFVIFGVVFMHIWALHVTGSNNPLGIDVKSKKDTIPFNPYYTIKDAVGLLVFIVIYAIFIFYAPNYLGHPDNYIPANPMQTPPHIVPEWYFLPFYAILRSITFDFSIYIVVSLGLLAISISPLYCSKIKLGAFKALSIAFAGIALFVVGYLAQIQMDNGEMIINLPNYANDYFDTSKIVEAKLGGVLAMFGAIVLMFVLPWLDTHPVRSARFRPIFRVAIILFVIVFIFLGLVGGKPAEGIWPIAGLIATGAYYAFFLVVCPYLSKYEKAKPLPESIHQAVLDEKGK